MMSDPARSPGETGRQSYVLLLNWGQPDVTLVALESLFRMREPDFRVIVCDNGSGDGSLERFAAWAEGAEAAVIDGPEAVRALCEPPVPKPISTVRYSRLEAEVGGDSRADDARLVLIDNAANLGFAAGNNVGLRYALARGDFDYVWVLNNDTAVDANALTALIERATTYPAIGICGSTLRYFERPETVQAYGGCRFRKWSASAHCHGAEQPASEPIPVDHIRANIDLVHGASMLVSRPFLEKIGLIDERFFVYFEEITWALRSKGQFTMDYAPDSVVFHRAGYSTGVGKVRKQWGGFGEMLLFANKVAFARLYSPAYLPGVYLFLVFVLFKALLTGRWGRFALLFNWRLWAGRPSFPTQ